MPITIPLIAADGATSTVTIGDPPVVTAGTPVSIFTTQVPALTNLSDSPTATYELGCKFTSSVAGQIRAIRFWKGSAETTGHVGHIWSATGALLATVTFANETASGWQLQQLTAPLTIAANTTYVVSVGTSNTRYVATDTGLATAVSNGPLKTIVGGNGVYGPRGAFPTATYMASNYFRDVVFVPTGVAPPPVPVMNPASFSTTTPYDLGALIGTVTASNNPTSFAITSGNASNYFTLDNSGNLRTSATIPVPQASYNIGIAASNAGGQGPSMLFLVVDATLGPPPPPPPGGILPADRDASANWQMAGLLSVGGIPNRTTVYTTISPIGGGADDTSNIQTALNNCPLGQVVALSAGTFTIVEGKYLGINVGITLRGAGATATILNRVNGATLGTYVPGSNPSPAIKLGGSSAPGSTTALTADALKGSYSVQVSSSAGYIVGEIVLLDEASGSGWQPDRVNADAGEQIWASPDYRVVWNIHNPSMGGDDGAPAIYSYFQVHADHPTNEMHQISAINGNTITFDSPVTISYRISHGAQLTPMIGGPTLAGIENLAIVGGDDANIQINSSAYSWIKNVDCSLYLNDGVSFNSAFRAQLEGVYIHNACWPVPGGAGYNISLAFGSSECLIQNCISVLANKVMVCRAAGTGSVIAYNYMDQGFISGSDGWVEIGLNASHLVGPHHVLFEGNWGFNCDSDQTHGNATYLTFFRNWLTGYRSKFTDYLNSTVIDDISGGTGPLRAAGAHAYAYQFSWIGNVLGTSGKMSGWVYDGIGGPNAFPPSAIWALGWVDISPQGYDSYVEALAVRDGNYDFLQNKQSWHTTPATFTIPNSLYLMSKPAFFGANPWPWTDPATGTINTLPAKARFDAGTPNTVL